MKLYAYCIVEGLDRLDDSSLGISDSKVSLLKIEEFGVLVSDTEIDAVPVTRENALAHAAVVRSVLDRTTPLPFRFGTLVTEQQLGSYITTRKSLLKTKLAHVRGCVEMNVKVIQQLSDAHESRPSQPEPVISEGPGTAFLLEKRREIAGDERKAEQAAELSSFVSEILDGLVRDEQVVLRPSEKLVLAAAHLVERSSVTAYREKMTEAIKWRPELHFLVSGPWPPYSFANIELEFPTQFGVT
jgi:Gas vesicle synthesis protein GvpL/GvpF